MNEIKFEIVEEIGVLSESSKGWRTELNLVSWNEREPKYDLRNWSENHEKIVKCNSKGRFGWDSFCLNHLKRLFFGKKSPSLLCEIRKFGRGAL